MKLLSLILSLTFATTCLSDKAPKIKKNPKNLVAIADFPFGGDKNIKGNVVFTSSGKYVNVHVDMTGFPHDEGPFYYHIHERSVPENGNCEACGLHFNPYNSSPDCLAQKHNGYCQVGDLSGKHGAINSTCFEFKFTDPYLSLNKRSKSYIVGRSLVFHYANMSKLACADIELANDLRLQSLMDEYVQTDDTVQVQQLKQSMDHQSDSFDALEALRNEVYESDNDGDEEKEQEGSGAVLLPPSLQQEIKEPKAETKQNNQQGESVENNNNQDSNDSQEDLSKSKNFKHILQDVKVLPQKLVNKTKNHWSKDDESKFGKKSLDKSIHHSSIHSPNSSEMKLYQNQTNVTLHGISQDCSPNSGASLFAALSTSFLSALLNSLMVGFIIVSII
ncbi:hypothetical protein KGF57_003163 [Candida theae]|uniref:superoxide dismutase n=1 Tax=Candida theae TaxID=1198502 RepID=A0AAD5BDB4_9ASCO|nr:uncharacterized protein KGF57_003163 [Candida theae]KAI5957469.1 hypothetical protein KGF57_003163 [Candida theae]